METWKSLLRKGTFNFLRRCKLYPNLSSTTLIRILAAIYHGWTSTLLKLTKVKNSSGWIRSTVPTQATKRMWGVDNTLLFPMSYFRSFLCSSSSDRSREGISEGVGASGNWGRGGEKIRMGNWRLGIELRRFFEISVTEGFCWKMILTMAQMILNISQEPIPHLITERRVPS